MKITKTIFCFTIAFIFLIAGCKKDKATTSTCFKDLPASVRIDSILTFTPCTANGTSYLWMFGDGTTDTSATAQHAYVTIGTYTVTLATTTAGGTTTDTKTITVHKYNAVHFSGNFSVQENCDNVVGTLNYVSSITAIGTDTITIANFGSFPGNIVVKGTVTGNMLQIQPQVFYPTQPQYMVTILGGTGTISTDIKTIHITYQYSKDGTDDECSLTATRNP